jgi:hypothetical protein
MRLNWVIIEGARELGESRGGCRAPGMAQLTFGWRERKKNVGCQLSSANSFPSPTYTSLVHNSLFSIIYAKTGGYPLPQKCRRADIFDFLPYILHFLVGGASCGRAGPVNSFGAQKTRLRAGATLKISERRAARLGRRALRRQAERACRPFDAQDELEAGATRKREEGGIKPPLPGTKR